MGPNESLFQSLTHMAKPGTHTCLLCAPTTHVKTNSYKAAAHTIFTNLNPSILVELQQLCKR